MMLPPPYAGALPAGQIAIVQDDRDTVIQRLAGNARLIEGNLLIRDMPDAAGLSFHGGNSNLILGVTTSATPLVVSTYKPVKPSVAAFGSLNIIATSGTGSLWAAFTTGLFFQRVNGLFLADFPSGAASPLTPVSSSDATYDALTVTIASNADSTGVDFSVTGLSATSIRWRLLWTVQELDF